MEKKSKKRLAVVGALPPPFGGVSVHVKRYMELLKESDTIEAKLYDLTGKNDPANGVIALKNSPLGYIKFLLSFKEDLVHFHFNNHRALAIAGQFLPWRKKKSYVVTIHSARLIRWYDEKGFFYRKSISDCFRRAAHLICVGQPIADFMTQRLGIDPSKVSLIPAFLPPTKEERSESHIPDEVLAFVSGKETVVGTHGWFGYFIGGDHVYSFDHVAKLAQEIADSGRNIVLYTVISGCYEKSHRAQIKALQAPLSDVWMIVETPFSCAALYEKTDIFVRPTITDGDSVSIRECLNAGVRVLASDAVQRPKQCHLYPSRNYDKLSSQFWNLLDSDITYEPDNTNPGAQLIGLVENLFDIQPD